MTSSNITIDALWHCLCPSFNSSLLLKSPLRPRPNATTRLTPVKCARSAWTPAHAKARNQARIWHKQNTDAGTTHIWAKGKLNLKDESTPLLYELLRTSARNSKTQEVEVLVDRLVRVRHQPPDSRIYSALILANAHHSDGSVLRVNALLQEMERGDIHMDIGICHDVLRVLSVHPDYILRESILHFMQQRWYNLSASGRHDLTAALFKEGQLELALTELERLRREGLSVPAWLFDMAIYTLLEFEEIEEALHLVHTRVKEGEMDISNSVWYHLLDIGSHTRHHAATAYVWKAQVIPGYINPASGICSNVLATACANGDTDLATDAFRVLGQRSTLFTADHYENLLTTYLTASPPDLRAALSVMTIMAGAYVAPTARTAMPLKDYLTRYPSEIESALEILTALRKQRRIIPVVAVNAILEADIIGGDFGAALLVYKRMHMYEEDPTKDVPHKVLANVETFNALLKGARDTTPVATQTALFLASESVALGIRPNSVTYDRLILVCIKGERLDLAWQYLEEMDGLGWTLRPGTASLLGSTLAKQGDERAWDVLQRVQMLGPKYAGVGKQIGEAWGSAESRLWAGFAAE